MTVGVVRGVARAIGFAAVVTIAAAAAASCAVDGDPSDSLSGRSVPASAFPVEPGADVTVVDPAQLSAIVGDISGAPVGAQIQPGKCAPQPISALPADTVVQTGFGAASAPGSPPSAYTTVITRTGHRLADVVSTVASCRTYTRASATTVTVEQQELSSVPSVAGAEVFGYTRTETAAGSPPVRTTLLIAQRGTVRVYAAKRVSGASTDTASADTALVTLFEAVAAAGLR